jgi:hypothetical protein
MFGVVEMLKAEYKELNYFDHWNTLSGIDNKKINNLLVKIENKTSKLTNKKYTDKFVIIHRCTKEGYTNMLQCSFFDKYGAIRDIVRNDYREIIKEIRINDYELMEVV